MTFRELYDSCFRNIQLSKISISNDPEPSTTLEQVMNSSQYVVFFLTAGTKGGDVARRLDLMERKRNERDKDKPQNSPARLRRLFTLKKKKKKDSVDEISTVSVIAVDTDHTASTDAVRSISHPGWYLYTPQGATTRSRLLRALCYEFSPSVIIVDTSTHNVITTEGRRLLSEDQNGLNFPWWPPLASDLLKGPLVRASESADVKLETFGFDTIKANVRGFLFGAFWCPPCRQWVKQLGPVYTSLKERNISFEIIFCSSDRTPEAFNQFCQQMPWPAFAYDTAKTIALTRLFSISGIPSLILVDADGNIVSRHGRSTLLGDPNGELFPWGPRAMYELEEHSIARLRDEPSLILFTEGSPEDVNFSISVLDGVSRKLFAERCAIADKRAEERVKRLEERENIENGNSNSLSKSASSEECSSTNSADVSVPPQADPLQIFFTGEDPICDHILEKILGLEDAELPLICIVDGLAGQMAVCEQPDVSEKVIDDFVEAYRSAQLKWTPLPSATEGPRTVGGIPTAVIEQVMIQSPSQNSVGEPTTS